MGFPLETGCLAPSARTETEKLSEAKAGYTREGAEGAVWGARASLRQGERPANRFRSADCLEGKGVYWNQAWAPAPQVL